MIANFTFKVSLVKNVFKNLKDSSIKSPGYDCFLNIERFKYSTNVTDEPGFDLEVKDPFEDQDIEAALRKRYKKLPFSSA
ncbi:hypothetical protein F8M41_022928 [Gigaspora margarita]|uniref:Uncharacterized protein n=1 Tax=Gigaspora margarita TaxID=4874 RepID=A0A8H4AE88_GIGMA|nr:hypothetical protein F8M41_022928 [Gigaspora margarita]